MNWTKFQLHDLSQEKAFETLCNQLFENWCKEEYGDKIKFFNVVNGAGGDGGVESYTVLLSNGIIGLQAKWFPNSITSSHINQIKNSIKTAIKVRPQITKYVVCVPRDLASATAKGDNNEEKRWSDLVAEINKEFPKLVVELWNDAKLTTELQKPNCAGICRFWFESSEISRETLKFTFEKAKNSWLHTKYVPDLNTEGEIEKSLQAYLGSPIESESAIKVFKLICKLCNDFDIAATELLALCDDKNTSISELIIKIQKQLDYVVETSKKIINRLYNDSAQVGEIKKSEFIFDYAFDIEIIKKSTGSEELYFHKSDVIKALKNLSEINCYNLFEYLELADSSKSLLIIGAPGTGKTHGVSAFSEKILSSNLHLPLLIQAKDIAVDKTWKEIIQTGLGMGNEWNEEELWQGLSSLVNRYKFYKDNVDNDVRITPKMLIIIDGLDEFATREKWEERIKEANVICSTFPQIRFCFTSRPIVFSLPINWSLVKQIGNNGDVPVYKLFDTYTKAYNVTAKNVGWLKHALSTPLALKLFCELNRDKSVDYSRYSDVAIPNLWRKKIETIENEYSLKWNISSQNQYVLKMIVLLAELYTENNRIERSQLFRIMVEKLTLTQIQAEDLMKCFEVYGIVTCYRIQGIGILPDNYFYYPGIQGYFDYATAEILIGKFEHPKDIDFNECKSVSYNALYGLAIVSIQRYNYLITNNKTISAVIEEAETTEIQFYALQHTDHKNAEPYVRRSKEIMAESATKLILIVNKLVLPLSRYDGHPLGTALLDNFLSAFDKPAQRDIIWSVQAYLNDAYEEKWSQRVSFELENEEYILTSDDTYNGRPVIYAWALSTINNSMRKLYRQRLMEWARLVPEEFFKLFLKFSNVNDSQILSDLYSILVCLVYEYADKDFIENVSRWICNNVLHPDKIDYNRYVSIRYYSIAIIKKAVLCGILNQAEAELFLPPYSSSESKILLNEDALKGTRMGGYMAIDYDLARYVLIDHFQYVFEDYYYEEGGKFYELIKNISKRQPQYKGITTDQFIISAAYAYILQMGWNESEFYNYKKNKDGTVICGVDTSILCTYPAATHGGQSEVMTICEKYVWQARNYISGFLCDRLLFGDENIRITDYGLIDDFLIPTQEIKQIDPDNIPIENPWHIPEENKVLLKSRHSCKNDVINRIKNVAIVDWSKWIFAENNKQKYKIECKKLLALNMYSCFHDFAGVETDLFINSIVINKDDVSTFLGCFSGKRKLLSTIYNPSDWYGAIDSSCYITPKEVCWFPWKKRYDSNNVGNFPSMKISSAVDKCIYNFPEFGDVQYHLPAPYIRTILDICDTDGYLFWDNNRSIPAEFCIAGKRWETYQEYLWIDKDILLSRLADANQTIIWIMKELRNVSGKSHEKYGEFYVEREKVSIGYFDNDEFIVKEVKEEFISNENDL